MVNACLESLLRDDYPAFDVVVVDNTDEGSFSLAHRADERIRVVREGRPGLSRARNTGIRNARHDILAFIDDDVTVDGGWMRAIASALKDESIAGVTGLVVPAELETQAQREFEWYGGMSKGRERRLICGAALSAWRAIGVQQFGVGANMAFRRSVFQQVGSFDEALGGGTATLGAEDLDFFHRVLREGLTLCYEPAAQVRHRHRRTVTELRSQVFANGCSYSVYLLKIWSRRTVPRHQVAIFAVRWAVGRLGTALFRSIARPGIRCLLAWDEVRGAMHAPAAYRRAYGGA
jgi:GT2 family glycosyltransferase